MVEEKDGGAQHALEGQAEKLTGELMETKKLLGKEVLKRTRSEAALRESVERCQTIINSIEDAYWEIDLSGNLTVFNDALCVILGYSRDELMGSNYRQYMSQDIAETFYRTSSQVCLTGKPTKIFDLEVIGKDGERRFLETSILLIRDAEGQPVGFRGIARDMTQQKKVMRELETLNEVKEKLISHLSHELITPIALVEVSLDYLAGSDASEPQKEKAIERIRRNLDRLKDIQEIAMEMVTPYEYQPEPLQLDVAAEDIIDTLRAKSAHRALTILTRLECINTNIIDPRIFKKVIAALVKNAIENTPDEGKVMASLTTVPGGVILKVEDHGVGIAEGDLQRILRGFYHTQQTELYSTKKPFDFNAGGKGLELMRLKLLETAGAFRISFESSRCCHILADGAYCIGTVSLCPYIRSEMECIRSGGTTFSALFFNKRSQE